MSGGPQNAIDQGNAGPSVSFIVPCYKLAHLLGECVNSILSQSFSDLEVLIMDDNSPDNTPEVAQSFNDPRVKHIRNDPNLGHLRNYNKGISLARGKYIWLISADDCLKQPYVLERYVTTMDANPTAGYAWCACMGLKDGKESGLLEYSVYEAGDRVIPGHEFLTKLLKLNIVPSASALVRKECDWYLWCLFALHFDVAYFSEPMVYYREHDLSMTNSLMEKSVQACCEEDVGIIWSIKQKADDAGFSGVSKNSLRALGHIYGRSMSSGRFKSSQSVMTWEQFEDSLTRYTALENEKAVIYAQACAVMADDYYASGDNFSAKKYYQKCLEYGPWDFKILAKMGLLSFGKWGSLLRGFMRTV
jgi:glycosyltransferase involved in cell wall biosynthesis